MLNTNKNGPTWSEKRNMAAIVRWLAVVGLFLAASLVFLDLAGDVWLDEGFGWDGPLMLGLHSMSRPWLDTVFTAITHTGGGLVLIPLAITSFFLWRRQELFTAVLLPVSYAGAMGMNSLLKAVFARPRPTVFPPLLVETSYSFPSGHAMSAVAFYGLLAILLWRRQRYGTAVLAGLWVPLVALSRVYLGVHYPSDVLASLAIGTIWLIGMLILLGEIPPLWQRRSDS